MDDDELSFWIEQIDLTKEDATLEIVEHLNFYMNYFDTATPRVLVHFPTAANSTSMQPVRYPHAEFPKEILASDLDDTLLQFWDASLKGDAIRRFLYGYQIIEYAAVYFVDDDVKRSIRRLLKAPDALSNVDKISDTLIDALSPLRMHDIQKRVSLFKQCVKCEDIWAELQNSKDYFEGRVSFDGGYSAEPLLVKDMRFVTFQNNWAATFEAALRHIRNGLSHGKEFSTSGIISPTIANQDRTRPWLGPLSLAARQVMLYRGVI